MASVRKISASPNFPTAFHNRASKKSCSRSLRTWKEMRRVIISQRLSAQRAFAFRASHKVFPPAAGSITRMNSPSVARWKGGEIFNDHTTSAESGRLRSGQCPVGFRLRKNGPAHQGQMQNVRSRPEKSVQRFAVV